MKHIKLFNEDSEYQEYIANNSALPNVSHCIAEDHVHYNPTDPYIIYGHEVVDLGLPSGLLWATTNLGAETFSDTGNYYQYGKGASTYDQTHEQPGYTGKENPLSSSADSATQVWGSNWRTPTQDEMIELIDNTTHQYVTNYKNSGVDGMLFTGTNGRELFLIAGGGKNPQGPEFPSNYGYYWSSSPFGIWEDIAKHMCFLGGDTIQCEGYSSFRACGYNVRPVTSISEDTK